MPKRYIVTFILATFFIIPITLFSFWAIVFWGGAGAIIFLVLIICILLMALIGPKSWRNFFKEYRIWLWTKASLFFPINPDKPIDEALKEGAKEFLPTKERAMNWLTVKIIRIIFSIILLISLFILYNFLSK